LKGARIGLAAGSTPAMDWENWGAGLDAHVVELKTDQLFGELMAGRIDAAVSWDPWVEDWLAKSSTEGQPLHIVAERPFHSLLAVSQIWALGGPDDADKPPRALRLVNLVAAALTEAARQRAALDESAAALSGWPIGVLSAVADRNRVLAGRGTVDPRRALAMDKSILRGFEESTGWVTNGLQNAGHFIGASLLDGHPAPTAPPPPGPQSVRAQKPPPPSRRPGPG